MLQTLQTGWDHFPIHTFADTQRDYLVHAGNSSLESPPWSCSRSHPHEVNLKPDLRHNRLNLDTGACYGGPLTAAAFIDEARVPVAFVFDDGQIGEVEALDTKAARLEVSDVSQKPGEKVTGQ